MELSILLRVCPSDGAICRKAHRSGGNWTWSGSQVWFLALQKKLTCHLESSFTTTTSSQPCPCWMRWPWEAMATVARCDKISSITFPSQQPRPSRNWGEEMEQTEAEHGRGQTAQVYPRLQHTHGRSGPAWPVCQPLQSQHPFQEVVVAMLQLGPEQCHGEQLVLLQVHKAICYLVISQLSLWCLTR